MGRKSREEENREKKRLGETKNRENKKSQRAKGETKNRNFIQLTMHQDLRPKAICKTTKRA